MTQRRLRQRGMALLIVLWTTSLLALIGTQVTATGRTEARLASNLRASAIAEAAADAAIQETALRLIPNVRSGKLPDGAPFVIRMPQAVVEVGVETEGRKLALNTSPPPMIAALLRGLGLDARAAATLADRMTDWRSPALVPLSPLGAKAPEYAAAGRQWGPWDRSFRSISDVSMVLGMTPPVLAAMAPHVSVYTQSAPKPETADPLVLAAMRAVAVDGVEPLTFDELPIYRINAVARVAGGGEFIRRAVIRLNLASDVAPPATAFDILGWFSGPVDPMAD